LEHDVFRKPVPTFPHHAPASSRASLKRSTLQKVPPVRAKKRQEPGRNRLRSFCNDEHDAEKWVPVSRLREARGRVRCLA
jgi:hypothetical protein